MMPNPFRDAPTFPFSTLEMLPVVAGAVFLMWFIATLILFYHWFRYGRHIVVSLMVLAVYLVVSYGLGLFAIGGFAP
jgi:hypothetical protein